MRAWAISILTGLAALGLTACSDNSDREFHGDTLIIYGAIHRADRTCFDATRDAYFARLGIEFDCAYAFAPENLLALEQNSIATDYPRGELPQVFEGPLLRDVLAIADADGRMIRVTALDGYQREIDMQRLDEHDVILALRRNGRDFALGGYGPAMLVWPRGTDPALTTMNDDDWVWGVIAIEVLP